MDLIYADEKGAVLGEIATYEADFAVGEENDFTICIPSDLSVLLVEGRMVYLDGTGFGGIVDDVEVDTKKETVTVGGRTAEGILASRYLLPDAGNSHLVVKGEANAVLGQLLSRMGLSSMLSASESVSGIQVNHQFDRYQEVYEGICEMLQGSGAKLGVLFSSGKAILSAEEIVDKSTEYELDNDQCDFVAKTVRPVNHLICAGMGEGTARDEIHLYADGNGKISTSQTFFGLEEVQAFYDYNNVEHDELMEKGIEKITEYQNVNECDVTDIYDQALMVGDIVGSRDNKTNRTVKASVSAKIARAKNGLITFELKAGKAQSSSTRSSGSSADGGVSYVAGKNVSIVGNTISADVGKTDIDRLEGKYDDTLKAASDASAAAGEATEQATASAVSANDALDQAINSAKSANEANASASASASAATRASSDATASAKNASSATTASENASKSATASAASASTAEKSATSSAASASSAASKASSAETKAANAEKSATAANSTAGAAKTVADNAATKAETAKSTATNAKSIADSAKKTAGDANISAISAVEVAGEAKRIAEDAASGGFLAAYPVGSYFKSSTVTSPAVYGGTWEQAPSLGAFVWHRIK